MVIIGSVLAHAVNDSPLNSVSFRSQDWQRERESLRLWEYQGWTLKPDGRWYRDEEADNHPGLTDEEMSEWLDDKRSGNAQDIAEWDARE
jgi:hypothetical protein